MFGINNNNIYSGYKVSFGGDNANSVQKMQNQTSSATSNPISSEYSTATRSVALAQISMDNSLSAKTTKEEYISKLLMHGKIPNKNFVEIKKDVGNDNGSLTVVEELNSVGQKTKETTFCKDNKTSGTWNSQSFFSPNCPEIPYKTVEYKSDGSVSVQKYDSKSHKMSEQKIYTSDGQLKEKIEYDESGKVKDKNQK